MRVSVSVGLGNRQKSVIKLVFSTYLKIISGFGLPVLHGIFFHAHECGTRIGLGIGVTFSKGIRLSYFHQLVTIPFKFPDLLLLCAELLSSLSFVAGWRSRASLSSSTMSESLQEVNSTDVIEFSCAMVSSHLKRIRIYPLVSYGSVRLSCARQKYICWLWIQS